MVDGEINVAGVKEVLKAVTRLDIEQVRAKEFDDSRDILFPLPNGIPYSVILAKLEEVQEKYGIYKISIAKVTLATVLHDLSDERPDAHEHYEGLSPDTRINISPTSMRARIHVLN